MALLIVPKLLACILLLTQTDNRGKFGGGLLVFAGILIETFLSGLIAPVMMIFQSSAVAEILLGRDAGWQVQRRDNGEWPRAELIRKYAWPTLFGIGMAGSAFAVSVPLLLWMAPVILGLLLSIPVAVLSSKLSKLGPLLFVAASCFSSCKRTVEWIWRRRCKSPVRTSQRAPSVGIASDEFSR